MASSLSTHAAARPHARGAAHASPDSRAPTSSGAMPHTGVMGSARMVAQRQRMDQVTGAGSLAGGATIQRMSSHPTPPASSAGSSSRDDESERRWVSMPVTGAAAIKKPPSQDPGASLGMPPTQ